MKRYIYVLKSPITLKIKYVGTTTKLKERYKNHCNRLHGNPTSRKRKWINYLLDNKLKPIMEVVDTVEDREEALVIEKSLIYKLRREGCNLVNTGDESNSSNITSFKKGHNGRKIVSLTREGMFIKEFNSIQEAELETKSTGIWEVVNRQKKTANERIWLYKEEYEVLTEVELQEVVFKARSGNTDFEDKIVIQYDLNNIFMKEWRCLNEIHRTLNLSKEQLANCIKGRSKTTGGYIFKYKI